MAKNKKADNQVSAVRRAKHGWVLTVFFSILAVLWLYPIFLVAMNSLRKKDSSRDIRLHCRITVLSSELRTLSRACRRRTFLRRWGTPLSSR